MAAECQRLYSHPLLRVSALSPSPRHTPHPPRFKRPTNPSPRPPPTSYSVPSPSSKVTLAYQVPSTKMRWRPQTASSPVFRSVTRSMRAWAWIWRRTPLPTAPIIQLERYNGSTPPLSQAPPLKTSRSLSLERGEREVVPSAQVQIRQEVGMG